MKLLCIIPVYNEKKDLVQSLVNESAQYVNKVLVINDGGKVDLKLNNCILLRNSVNKGKGYSLRKGFNYALTHKYDFTITMDGDGEHKPSDIPLFLEKIKMNDFVIGQRINYRSSLRNFLNRFSLFWVKILIPDINDVQCGYRAIKTKYLRNIGLKSDGFEAELEMILEAYKHKLKIGYVKLNKINHGASGVNSDDYIRMNKLFDEWVLKNKKSISLPSFQKSFLITSAKIGLLISNLLTMFK